MFNITRKDLIISTTISLSVCLAVLYVFYINPQGVYKQFTVFEKSIVLAITILMCSGSIHITQKLYKKLNFIKGSD